MEDRKKELTLEKVLELLNKNYNQKIKYLDGYEIEENDKTLNNKWINPDGSNKLEIIRKIVMAIIMT